MPRIKTEISGKLAWEAAFLDFSFIQQTQHAQAHTHTHTQNEVN